MFHPFSCPFLESMLVSFTNYLYRNKVCFYPSTSFPMLFVPLPLTRGQVFEFSKFTVIFVILLLLFCNLPVSFHFLKNLYQRKDYFNCRKDEQNDDKYCYYQRMFFVCARLVLALKKDNVQGHKSCTKHAINYSC